MELAKLDDTYEAVYGYDADAAVAIQLIIMLITLTKQYI